MKKILFLGTNNCCRTQMAEGFINNHFHGKAKAFSAGIDPTGLNNNAVQVMKEIGIDISNHSVNRPEDFKDISFDYIITLCDNIRENCPVFWTQGEAIYRHIGFENPMLFNGTKEQTLEKFRDIRDQIEERLLNFFDRELKTVRENEVEEVHTY